MPRGYIALGAGLVTGLFEVHREGPWVEGKRDLNTLKGPMIQLGNRADKGPSRMVKGSLGDEGRQVWIPCLQC
jgi:hypothetical protein